MATTCYPRIKCLKLRRLYILIVIFVPLDETGRLAHLSQLHQADLVMIAWHYCPNIILELSGRPHSEWTF